MKFFNKNIYATNFILTYVGMIFIFLIVLGEMNFYYMYLILVMLNSSIGIFAFIISKVTLSTDKELIYKDLAKIFGLVGLSNLLFAMYVFYNLSWMTLNQEIQITLLNSMANLFLDLAFIYIYSHKKSEVKISFSNIFYITFVVEVIAYFFIARTNILPPIYYDGKYSQVKDILCCIYLVGQCYTIFSINRLNKKFYNSKTVNNIKVIFICNFMKNLTMLFLGGINFFNININVPITNKFNCIIMTVLNFVYVYMVYIVCFRDIIKRPNQMLYYDLTKEKEKLQNNVKKLEKISFEMEYYKVIYEEIFRNMPIGILISYKDKIMFANNNILNLFKLKSENSVIGKNILDLVDKDYRDKYIKNINSLNLDNIDENKINTKFKYNNIKFDGEEVRFYEDIRGSIYQVSIISNLEDKIKLENARRELELRDFMDKTKNEFLSNISHEFKTPVNVIYSTVQIQDINLQKGNYGKILEFNQIIKQNCNRLIRLINNFIDSTKLKDNKIKTNLKCVNIVYLVEDITMSVVNFAKRQDINIIFDTEEEELFCEIDIEFMERIMLNLLSNAIKYNKKGGSIEVLIKHDENNIYIEVSDSGIGIPEEKIDKIFDRFERLKNENVAYNKGSGIGLNIVKQLVHAINGNIEIESVVNEGTVVRIILKKSYDEAEEIYDGLPELEEKVKLELSDVD